MVSPISPPDQVESLASQVRNAVIWRSGTQIAAQLVQWASTFLVIRILSPGDYGLFAMTGVVMAFLNMLNGYGLASAVVQQRDITERQVRQLFGMLIVLNLALGTAQFMLAPLAAAYYRQPEVAHLLRVQALIYIATPFIALPQALLSREMDFRLQGRVNILSSVVGAATALTGAFAGWGVWTLVFAPMMLFAARAAGITIAARMWIRPVFDFRGAGALARFGGMMAASQLFWFLQSQADVFIAGRHLTIHDLGIYTTSLFLAQIFVSKFVPPLNEVAFSAFARIQHDRTATAAAFVKGVRIVMLAALPFYVGLAVTAEPLVLVMLGEKWAAAAPVVQLLALAMPFMTLQVLFSPACDAMGRPGIGVRTGAIGSVILATGFLIGVQWGVIGLSLTWILCYPLYLAISCSLALPVIGARLRDIARAIAPSLLAAGVMAAIVVLVDRSVGWAPVPRLLLLVSVGAAIYGAMLILFARPLVRETVALVRNRV
ncbi:lipopolysaccharide biosynthesis protein [Sphingomonas sp.]|jgi:O-antigen/teichoic acid export membrane protein|uniref:lipopolysaccharide biosynthesis protein n=1 Tax=Sphingomonas sp. TaxID=28214 RepID=UPI002638BC86|nr:lipopolysaccharide biosynthesis protein [Sphingomonas sp.]MDF2494036.1 capsule biosynthesis protein CapK [Sphingomonas sp.]